MPPVFPLPMPAYSEYHTNTSHGSYDANTIKVEASNESPSTFDMDESNSRTSSSSTNSSKGSLFSALSSSMQMSSSGAAGSGSPLVASTKGAVGFASVGGSAAALASADSSLAFDSAVGGSTTAASSVDSSLFAFGSSHGTSVGISTASLSSSASCASIRVKESSSHDAFSDPLGGRADFGPGSSGTFSTPPGGVPFGLPGAAQDPASETISTHSFPTHNIVDPAAGFSSLADEPLLRQASTGSTSGVGASNSALLDSSHCGMPPSALSLERGNSTLSSLSLGLGGSSMDTSHDIPFDHMTVREFLVFWSLV